jgi:hypothetical protein
MVLVAFNTASWCLYPFLGFSRMVWFINAGLIWPVATVRGDGCYGRGTNDPHSEEDLQEAALPYTHINHVVVTVCR